MTTISLKHIHKSFGPVAVVKDLSLEIADREFLVLLGSSGCGKSSAVTTFVFVRSTSTARRRPSRPSNTTRSLSSTTKPPCFLFSMMRRRRALRSTTSPS